MTQTPLQKAREKNRDDMKYLHEKGYAPILREAEDNIIKAVVEMVELYFPEFNKKPTPLNTEDMVALYSFYSDLKNSLTDKKYHTGAFVHATQDKAEIHIPKDGVGEYAPYKSKTDKK